MTDNLLMIRPAAFAYNAETAVNNAFQVQQEQENINHLALIEFDGFVEKLRAHKVNVTIVNDTETPHTPDSIFPNNWISFHDDGTIVMYPMFAANRRLEREKDVLQKIGYPYKQLVDLTHFENDQIFLEGTGSMVLDREHKIAYACVSDRTHPKVLENFCKQLGYTPITFTATDARDQLIYHTNVMMCVADSYVVICLESIKNETERQTVITAIEQTGKTIVDISLEQINCFAGNMLQVKNGDNEKILVMSSQAFGSLTPEQLAILEAYNHIIHAPLDTIETNGGGSARCMMAELY